MDPRLDLPTPQPQRIAPETWLIPNLAPGPATACTCR